jgi:pilus assembly protein CpaE
MAGIPVLGLSEGDDVEERVAILEAGADDVLAKPADPRELESRVEALILRFHPATDASGGGTGSSAGIGERRLIACFSPKGGVGTTTIAVNIATLANQIMPGRVLLLDLDLQFGQTAMHLDLGPATRTIADLAQDEEALDNVVALRRYVTTHATGLSVLVAPQSPELAEVVTPRAMARLLATAGSAWEVLVADAGSTLDERTLAVLDAVTTVVVPVVADLGALRAVATLVDYLQDTGSVLDHALFALNNIFTKPPLNTERVQRALRREIAMELPFDASSYIRAINQGIPLLTDAPNSSAADALSRLATLALGVTAAEPASQAVGWRRFARLKRA